MLNTVLFCHSFLRFVTHFLAPHLLVYRITKDTHLTPHSFDSMQRDLQGCILAADTVHCAAFRDKLATDQRQTGDRPATDRQQIGSRPATDQRQVRDRPATDQRQVRDRPAADQRQVRDRPATDRQQTGSRPAAVVASASASVTDRRQIKDKLATS